MSVALALVLSLSAASPAIPVQGDKPSIRLDGIPTKFVIPFPRGENHVLRAEILNAKAKSVWLATSRGAAKKLDLSGAGANWQVNLADPRVGALAADAPQRSLRVFARLDAKRTIASTAMSFRLDLAPRRARMFVERGGVRRALVDTRSQWVRPAGIQRILMSNEGKNVDAVLEAGDGKYAFRQADDSLALALTPELRQKWRGAGVAHVTYSRFGQFVGRYTLRCIPGRLAQPDRIPRLQVPQRQETAIPKTNGWLLVRCGDVTGGQVSVSLRQADGLSLFTNRSMKQNDEISFDQHGRRYTLVLDKLVNVLIGSNDFGEFTLRPFSAREDRAA